MGKHYYLTCIETCMTCNGTGEVINPVYQEFGEFEQELKRKTGLDYPELYQHEDTLIAWWNERGYDVCGLHEIPDDHHCCYDCDGQGKHVSRVELADALAELASREVQHG